MAAALLDNFFESPRSLKYATCLWVNMPLEIITIQHSHIVLEGYWSIYEGFAGNVEEARQQKIR